MQNRSDMTEAAEKSDEELVRLLREAAAHWFNNTQLLLLEELIRRARLSRLGARE
jgi:hypothetical protein